MYIVLLIKKNPIIFYMDLFTILIPVFLKQKSDLCQLREHDSSPSEELKVKASSSNPARN